MKIAYNPETEAALTTAPSNSDITFDLKGIAIYAKGVKFKGTDTTYSVFKKHTSDNKGGYNGLVPVPSYTTTTIRYLREDGNWEVPIMSEAVTDLGTEGNHVTWTKNNIVNKLTVPYASTAALLAKQGGTSTSTSIWNPQTSWTKVWGQSFTDSSISSDTGDILYYLRAGEYSPENTELCVTIDGDYYAGTGQYKVWHAGNLTKVSQLDNDSGFLTSLPSHSHSYLPLAGGKMDSTAFISWNDGADGNDVSDWSITDNGLRIISSVSTDAKAPTQYSTALHVKGRYGFQLASAGGAASNSFYIKNVHNTVWNSLIHSGNISSQSVNYATSAGSIGGFTIANFMTYAYNPSYVAASFTDENLSKKAGEKYIEYWDSAGGWFNSAWGQVTANYGFVGNLSGTASYATSADNSDKLDNYHESDFFRYRGALYQKHNYDANTLGIGEYAFRSSAYGSVGTGDNHANALNENSTIQVFKWLQLSTSAWSDDVAYRVNWTGETNSNRPNGWSPWIYFLSTVNSSVSGGGSSGGSSITVNIGGTSKTLAIPTSLPANGGTADYINYTTRADKGNGYAQFCQYSGASNNPNDDWYSHIIMNHSNSAGYYTEIATCFHSDSVYFRRQSNGTTYAWKTFAWTSDIPTVTNYYWANVKVSSSSNPNTSPTFASATVTDRINATNYVFLNPNGSGIYLNSNSLNWHDGSVYKQSLINFTSDGKVGIDTTSPAYKLDVVGSAGFGTGSGCDVFLRRSGGYSYINATSSLALTVNNNSGNIAVGIATDKHATFYGSQTLYGLTSTCNKANDAEYMSSALQIREYNFGGAQSDTWAIAPRLSWHWSGRVQTQIGLSSSGDLKLSKDNFATSYLLLHSGNIGSQSVNYARIAGSAGKLDTGIIGSGSDSHASALRNYFNGYKASIPRNSTISLYSSSYGNGSQYMGYFLSGYNDTPYGGFFVAHYSNCYYVGITQGNYSEQQIITSSNIGSQSVNYASSAGTARQVTCTEASGDTPRPIVGIVNNQLYYTSKVTIRWDNGNVTAPTFTGRLIGSADQVDGYHISVVTSLPSTKVNNTIYILV